MLDEELMSEAFRFDHCLIFVFCVLWYIVSGYLTNIFPIELLLVENYWKGEVLTKLAMLDTEKDGDSGINELMEDGGDKIACETKGDDLQESRVESEGLMKKELLVEYGRKGEVLTFLAMLLDREKVGDAGINY